MNAANETQDSGSQVEHDPMMSVTDAAYLLSVSPATLYRGLKSGEIPIAYTRLGKRLIRIRKSAVETYIEENTQHQ